MSTVILIPPWRTKDPRLHFHASGGTIPSLTLVNIFDIIDRRPHKL